MDDVRPFTDLDHRYPLKALNITLSQTGGHQPDQAPTGITALSEATSIPIRTLQERHHTGLDPWQADEAACAAGLHVGDVWPDSAARDQIIGDPSYRAALMLDSLTKLCVDWCDPQPDDPEVSLEILRLVESAYTPEELARVDDLLAEFIDEKRDDIIGVLGLYEPNRDSTEILFRPEAAAIYERLTNRPLLLRAVWQNSDLPIDWLNEVSAAFGTGT